MNGIVWENLFLNKNIDEMTKLFPADFLRIMSQNIPNKIVTCNEKDAPWITSDVKTVISISESHTSNRASPAVYVLRLFSL